MLMYVIPYDSEIQRLAAKFDCGNSHLNAFLKSSRALDPGIGKTYVLLVDDASSIVGYYNIGVGYIEQQRDGMPQKMGGSVHINCFALDERFQKAPMDIPDLPDDGEIYHISDFLLNDCINRIEMIRDKHVGFSFITLCSTEK